MDVLKRAQQYIGQMWSRLSPAQKTVLGAAAAGIVLLVVWGSSTAAQDGMQKVVGAEVRAEERAQVLTKLQEKNQRHEVRGMEIYVPREDADRLILELAGEGVLTDRMVWSFLDEADVMASRWTLEKRFQVALQRKLENMIRGIEFVRYASVQLTPPDEAARLNFAGGAKASASVQLELKSGQRLARQNVMAIAGLVARAVQGLDPDRVHISDTQGHIYRVPGTDSDVMFQSDQLDLADRYEERIRTKIVGFFGEDVKVGVGIDLTGDDVHTEEVKLDKPTTVEEEDRSRDEKSRPAGGPPGIKAVGEVDTTGAMGTQSEVKEKESTAKSRTGHKTTVQHSRPGEVKKITVGVLIPLPVGADEQEVKRQEAMEPKIKELVLAAAGPKADLKDISVMFVPTRKPEAPPVPGVWEQLPDWLGRYGSTAALILLGVAGLFVMTRVLKAAIPSNVVEEIDLLRSKVTEEAGARAATQMAIAEEDISRMKTGIREAAARNPRNVASILKRWVSGK